MTITIDKVSLPGYQPTYEGNYMQIKTAADSINNARRPLIFAGVEY